MLREELFQKETLQDQALAIGLELEVVPYVVKCGGGSRAANSRSSCSWVRKSTCKSRQATILTCSHAPPCAARRCVKGSSNLQSAIFGLGIVCLPRDQPDLAGARPQEPIANTAQKHGTLRRHVSSRGAEADKVAAGPLVPGMPP